MAFEPYLFIARAMSQGFISLPESPVADDKACQNELLRLVERIGEIELCSDVGRHLGLLAADSAMTAERLLDAVNGDQERIDQILRRVNSSFYGLRNRVGDLPMAITLLGVEEVMNMASIASLSPLFRDSGKYRKYNRENLWRHCVGVAASARLIAQMTGKADPEEAFLAGLLHDLGYILIDLCFRQQFLSLLDQVESGKSTISIERKLWIFDHAQFGAFVCDKWGFSEKIVAAIQWHHDPFAYRGPHRPLVDLVVVANFLCSRANRTSLGVKHGRSPIGETFAHLELDRSDLRYLWKILPATLERSLSLT